VQLTERLPLPAAPERVWALVNDIHVVAACIPGARLISEEGHTYNGEMAFTLGPKKILFTGSVVFSIDEAARRGELTARGGDDRSSKASARVSCEVGAAGGPGESVLLVVSDVQFFGPIASFADTGGLHVGRRILAEFGDNLRVRLAASAADSGPSAVPPAARPLSGLRILPGLIWVYLRGLVSRKRSDESR
jgi:carbon monoxide dehydrogenase subunit G